MMNCSPEMKMKLKKMILEELLADMDHAEGKKLMPKPAVAVEIDAIKPDGLDMGKKMDGLAEGSPEEEKAEGPEGEKAEMLAGEKPDSDDMSDDDLKKLMSEYMG